MRQGPDIESDRKYNEMSQKVELADSEMERPRLAVHAHSVQCAAAACGTVPEGHRLMVDSNCQHSHSHATYSP